MVDVPGQVDLGLWNVFANPDFPNAAHQRRLARAMDLRAEDVAPLTAFLRSLNEDYE